jgi:LysM repeat protein
MLLKQNFSAGRVTLGYASLSVLLALVAGGCSMFSHRGQDADSTAAAPVPVATDSVESSNLPQTDTEALGDLAADSEAASDTTTVMADAGPALKPSAPKDYVVRRGDTLWGIANTFLRDPWTWPEIWYVNPKIANPHRIYPGDTIHLALSGDGRTALQVVRGGAGLPGSKLEPMLRSSSLDGAISTIPYAVIAAFLARPGIISREEIGKAPYILALRGEHDAAGEGDELYVKKLDEQNAGARYAVMHVDEALHDPDGHRNLGFLAIYAGTAQLTRPGPIAKATMTDSARETLQGDLLVAEDVMPTSDFKPHAPAHPIHGKIIAVVEGSDVAGQYDVVAINRGSDDGLDRGTVLAADEGQAYSDDPCAHIKDFSTCLWHPQVALPNEAAGTLLVFKTYQQMSFALVLRDTVPIAGYAGVRNP